MTYHFVAYATKPTHHACADVNYKCEANSLLQPRQHGMVMKAAFEMQKIANTEDCKYRAAYRIAEENCRKGDWPSGGPLGAWTLPGCWGQHWLAPEWLHCHWPHTCLAAAAALRLSAAPPAQIISAPGIKLLAQAINDPQMQVLGVWMLYIHLRTDAAVGQTGMMLLLLRNWQAMVLIALVLQPCELGQSGRVGHLPYDPEGHVDNVHEIQEPMPPHGAGALVSAGFVNLC